MSDGPLSFTLLPRPAQDTPQSRPRPDPSLVERNSQENWVVYGAGMSRARQGDRREAKGGRRRGGDEGGGERRLTREAVANSGGGERKGYGARGQLVLIYDRPEGNVLLASVQSR